MKCKVCGNQLNDRLRCTRCYAPHSTTSSYGKVDINLLAPSPLIEMECNISIEPGLLRIASNDEEYLAEIRKRLAHHLASEIVEHLETTSIYDESTCLQVVSASLRVVKPYYEFDR